MPWTRTITLDLRTQTAGIFLPWVLNEILKRLPLTRCEKGRKRHDNIRQERTANGTGVGSSRAIPNELQGRECYEHRGALWVFLCPDCRSRNRGAQRIHAGSVWQRDAGNPSV